MARGLNQFAVGTLTDATKVTGTSSTPPGNDRVIQVRLTALALRNRAQPFSYNVVSQTIRQVESASGGTGVNTRYVVYKATKDCVLDAVTVHVRQALTTTVFPEVTIDGYLQKDPYAANSSSNTFDPNANGETVVIVPELCRYQWLLCQSKNYRHLIMPSWSQRTTSCLTAFFRFL